MDEEASFANLLSQSIAPARPTWETSRPPDDPWANPFSDTPTSNPFASAASPFASTSTYAQPLDSPREDVSPYVQKLQEDEDAAVGILPDPPSVIAAREQEESGFASPYDPPSQLLSDPFVAPHILDPSLDSITTQQTESHLSQSPAQPVRKLPSDLLDDDILGTSDPSASLKKAFVKSTTHPRKANVASDAGKPKAYVFNPDRSGTAGPFTVEEKERNTGQNKKEALVEMRDNAPVVGLGLSRKEHSLPEDTETPAEASLDEEKQEDNASAESGPLLSNPTQSRSNQNEKVNAVPLAIPNPALSQLGPASIPLPTSSDATPIASRPVTPVGSLPVTKAPDLSTTSDNSEPSPADVAVTPTVDRVAVSPLDARAHEAEHVLSLGTTTSSLPPPPPSKSPIGQDSVNWTSDKTNKSPLPSKLAGKGWSVVDDQEDGGLFGKGGPSTKSNPWGGNDAGSWGEIESFTSDSKAGPSHLVGRVVSEQANEQVPKSATSAVTQEMHDDDDDTPLAIKSSGATKPKSGTPTFHISIGDPTRVGDPVRGYTVYTIRTHTTSPHYRRSEFSVLRRFSEFLWLFDALTMNNPGVVVPPMPDKHPFGRFQDQFIETRRLALQRCLTKLTSHPILQLDPDLRLFLESDAFAIEAKNRRIEVLPEKQGLLAGWTGPKYIEQDDWFDSRRAFLDNLESQLKSLSKAIETASKSRLDMAMSMGEFADSIKALAESDLGSAMCAALARLADLSRREKESNEEQAKSDVIHLLNMADEYVRFIASVRLAFASRIKTYQTWQHLEKEVLRLRSVREKLRQSGKLGDRTASSLGEIGEVSV